MIFIQKLTNMNVKIKNQIINLIKMNITQVIYMELIIWENITKINILINLNNL